MVKVLCNYFLLQQKVILLYFELCLLVQNNCKCGHPAFVNPIYFHLQIMDYGLAYPQQFHPAEPKPIPLRTQTSTPTSPKTLSFWAERPSFLYRTPSVTLFPPSLCLSPALCLYRGAVRAPLLKLLLKREHIQWGLSQSYSVSMKELGNTTLSREAFLKGQKDSGLSNLSASASHLSHGKQSTTKEVFCFFFIKKILQQSDGGWILHGLRHERQHHLTSLTTAALYQLPLLPSDEDQRQTFI